MKIDKDQVVLHVARGDYNRLSRDAREALQMYAEHFWWTRLGVCAVVAEYRIEELQALTGAAASSAPNAQPRASV